MNNYNIDILVIGSGLSGAIAALSAAEEDKKVILITKEPNILSGNTIWAQGGIAYKGKNDKHTIFEQDILEAGNKNNYKPAVNQIATKGPQLIEELLIKFVSENNIS